MMTNSRVYLHIEGSDVRNVPQVQEIRTRTQIGWEFDGCQEHSRWLESTTAYSRTQPLAQEHSRWLMTSFNCYSEDRSALFLCPHFRL